jgi:hypothetical protein
VTDVRKLSSRSAEPNRPGFDLRRDPSWPPFRTTATPMRKLTLNCNRQSGSPCRRVALCMKTLGRNLVRDYAVSQCWPKARQAAFRPSYLHLVTAHDLQALRDGLPKGQVPPDLEAKLATLAVGDLGYRFIEQKCRTIIALVLAAEEGSFKEASRIECELLTRVLAYVRKDDDAIPDYRPDGFVDDQQVVRAVTTELNPLLQAFKAWRLRYQVPGMWLNGQQDSRPWAGFPKSSPSRKHFC